MKAFVFRKGEQPLIVNLEKIGIVIAENEEEALEKIKQKTGGVIVRGLRGVWRSSFYCGPSYVQPSINDTKNGFIDIPAQRIYVEEVKEVIQ